jgi:hypothetical protein
MKTKGCLVVAMTLISSFVYAQTTNRAMLIQRIEKSYTQATAFTADSPFVDTIIRSARVANAQASPELWQSIKPEFSSALNEAQHANGGPLAGQVNSILSGMSDSDVEHLAVLLEDPILLEFQAAAASPAIQQKAMQAASGLVLRYGAAINEILAHHGLKEIH